MAKLKNIIRELTEEDFNLIFHSLLENSAEKSAYLFRHLREDKLSDNKIMDELEVNTNAYYTLRSRLNQKIEEYLLQQMENPRADLLKKVANITDIVFTKKKAIAIATLKKLEKELLDYDLSSELTIVYKNLKKLHLNTDEHYHYSQLYNRHVAYMLALDKAEDLVANYFRKYGEFLLSGGATEKMELDVMNEEIANTSQLYQSHRLYVYQACINIFHRLYVRQNEEEGGNEEAIDDILTKVERIFEDYYLDAIYYNLKLVFEFLKFEYYTFYRVYKKAEKFYEEVNTKSPTLLSNYSLFTFPARFLISKLDKHVRLGTLEELYEDNKELYRHYDPDLNEAPAFIVYTAYRALSAYYVDQYEEAARWINNLLNEMSLKKYPLAQVEIKLLLALQYCLMDDYDLFNQAINSTQRQIRLMGEEAPEHLVLFSKFLKALANRNKKNRNSKMQQLAEQLAVQRPNYYSPLMQIDLGERFFAKHAD